MAMMGLLRGFTVLPNACTAAKTKVTSLKLSGICVSKVPGSVVSRHLQGYPGFWNKP